MSEKEVPITPELAGMFGKLEKLAWLEGEDCLLGTIHVFGVPHFVTCVRVHLVCWEHTEGDACPLNHHRHEGTNDPHNRLEDILTGDYDGPPTVVKLPGLEGDWVIGVDPYRD